MAIYALRPAEKDLYIYIYNKSEGFLLEIISKNDHDSSQLIYVPWKV